MIRGTRIGPVCLKRVRGSPGTDDGHRSSRMENMWLVPRALQIMHRGCKEHGERDSRLDAFECTVLHSSSYRRLVLQLAPAHSVGRIGGKPSGYKVPARRKLTSHEKSLLPVPFHSFRLASRGSISNPSSHFPPRLAVRPSAWLVLSLLFR